MRRSTQNSARAIVTIATVVLGSAATSFGQSEPAEPLTSPAMESTNAELTRIEGLLQAGRIVEARADLSQLKAQSLTTANADRVLELLAAAERRLRSMSEVEVSLQKAELALTRGDLRLAETHARAARRHDRATGEDITRADHISSEILSLRAELTPMVPGALEQAVADFDAGRFAQAKAGFGSVVRIGGKLSQEQVALLNRYRDRIFQMERKRGAPFEAEYVPLAILRGRAQAQAGVVAAAAIAQNGQDAQEQAEPDPLKDADRFDAERLFAEANAAYDDGRYNEASEKFQLLLAQYATFLDEGQLAQARDRRLDAQVRLGGQEGGALRGFQEDRAIMIQEARAEFDNAINRSNQALGRGDINEARNLAAQARFRWTDAFNNGLFSEDQYRGGVNTINTLVSRIDSEEERLTVSQIRDREAALKRAEATARAQQESQRKARIRESLDRLRSLQLEQKYAEALEVAEQVLFLDPGNPAAMLVQDVLKDVILYREFEQTRRARGLSYARESVSAEKSLVIPGHIMDYPPDWPEISFRRGEVQSFVESDSDRRVLAALETKRIPATFDNNRLEDVVSFLASVTNLNVDVDWDSLEQIGIERDTPVSLNLREVPARVVLDRVLEKTRPDPFTKADWAVNDGVLVVAAEESLRRNTFVVIYDIRDLLFQIPDFDDLPKLDLDDALGMNRRDELSAGTVFEDDPSDSGGPSGPSEQDMMDQILDIIQTNVDFSGWRDNGGSTGVVQELNGNLIITNTAKNHRQIQGLLNQLREIRSVQINVESRFLTVSQDFFEQIGFDLDLTLNAQNSQFRAVQDQFKAFGQGGLTNEGLSLVPSDTVTGRQTSNTGYTPIINAQGVITGFNFATIPASIPAPDGFSQVPVFQDSLGITDALVRSSGTAFAQSVLGPVGSALNPALSVAATFLDDVQVDFLVEATQADQRSVALSAPRLTFSNGRSANISVINQVGFISNLTPVVGTSSVAFNPTIGRINSGFTLGVRGVASADRRYVTLTVQAAVSGQPSFTSQTLTAVAGGGGGGTGNTIVIPPAEGIIQIPVVDVTQVNTGVTIPDKGTILLGGQRLTNELEIESGVPVLSKLPIINRFFTNRSEMRDEQTLLILMKPTIIIQNEREEAEFPGLLDRLKNPFR